jgi:hypothetical protein
MKKIEFKSIKGISLDLIALMAGCIIGAIIKTVLF